MRRLIIATAVAAALAAGAAPAVAQQASPSPPLVKWGKWALLGGAVTMNLLAAEAHDDANDVFELIEARCATDATRCYEAADGALLGAAALFIWEFTRPKALPENIPFEPEIEVGARETRLSLRVAF